MESEVIDLNKISEKAEKMNTVTSIKLLAFIICHYPVKSVQKG